MSRRKSIVSGYFYPDTKEEIDEFINHFNRVKTSCTAKCIQALIVPHAGYIYSGYTANLAYNLASNFSYKKVIVIGPSHKIAFNGVSVSTYESYETPLGDLKIDLEFVKSVKERFDFIGFNDLCHKEHSTETQMPLIANYFPNVKVVEIVYGKIDDKTLSNLVDFILEDGENLLVISTDLSHFYPLKKANTLDNICIEGIKNQNISMLNDGCEACGIIGVKALLQVSKKYALESRILNYTTSYERTKEKDSVVGYVSAVFGKF